MTVRHLRILKLLAILFLFPHLASASQQVLNWPAKVPIVVCQPNDANSDCGGTGGSGSGNVGVGTVNYVPVYVGVSTLGPSNIVAVSGNVGVGTTVPSAVLHVTQVNAADTVRFEDQAGDTSPFVINQDGNVGVGTFAPEVGLVVSGKTTRIKGTNVIGFGDDGNATVKASAATSGNLLVTTGGNTRMSIGVNVGIGSTVPGAKLDISGDTRIVSTNKLYLSNDNTVYMNASANTSADIVVSTASTERMRVGQAGSVSVGTTQTSASPLLVNTDVDNRNVAYFNVNDTTTTSPGAYLEVNNSNSTAGNFSAIGFSYLPFGSPSAWLAAKQYRDSNHSTSLLFATTPTSGLIRQNMILDYNGNLGVGTTTPQGSLVVLPGNVGFGTVSPQFKMQVVGGNIGVGTYTVCTSAGTECPQSPGGSTTPGGSSPQLQYNNGGSFGGIGSGGSDGTNIGINTVSFTNRLNIVGGVGISTLAQSPYVNFTAPSGTAMMIDGNVGIGTWTTFAGLDIEGGRHLYLGDVAVDQVVFGSPDYDGLTGSSTLTFVKSTSALTIGTPQGSTNGIINAGDENTGGQINLSGGPDSVGMFNSMYNGTAASKTSALVNDNIGLWEANGYNASAGNFTRAGAMYIVADADFASGGDVTDSPGRIEMWTTPDGSSTQSLRMVIKNNGNVGIGTTAPTNLLQVVGGNIGVGTYTVCTSQGLCPGSGGAGSTAQTTVNLPVYSAKLTGAFVVLTPTGGDASTQGAQIDAGDGNWRLLFDATTDEAAAWQFVIPNNYSSTPVLNVYYSMASATSGTVEFEGAIMCVSSGDSADIGTASFSSVAVASETVPGTAGYLSKLSITLNDDSCASGDQAFIYLSTDANDGTNDTATGDREVVGVTFSYTGS